MASEEEEIGDHYKRAAQAIKEADIILITSGAGWSVASSLPVYNDVAKSEEWGGRSYNEIAKGSLFKTNPKEAFSFWLSCLEMYRNAPFHQGYSILKKWLDSLEHKSEQPSSLLRKTLANSLRQDKNFSSLSSLNGVEYPLGEEEEEEEEEERKNLLPGTSFCYTSNVDSLWPKSHLFPSLGVYEIHGSTEWWSCSESCCQKLYEGKKVFPSLDQIDKQKLGDGSQIPKCPSCKSCPLRPAVQMFDDNDSTLHHAPRLVYNHWREIIVGRQQQQQQQQQKQQQQLQVTILEIGCGRRVPHVRMHNEALLRELGERGLLIRINPDDVTLATTSLQKDVSRIVPLKETAVRALQLLDQEISKSSNEK